MGSHELRGKKAIENSDTICPLDTSIKKEMFLPYKIQERQAETSVSLAQMQKGRAMYNIVNDDNVFHFLSFLQSF